MKPRDFLYFFALMVVGVIIVLIFAPSTVSEPVRSPEQLQLDTIYMHVEEIRQGVRAVTQQLYQICLDLTSGDKEFCKS